tara:strand:- start:1349 stop:1627 length:279 start_codon:yes stop_codon:yes gene_type:complete
LDKALPLAQILFKFALSLSKRIGRLTSIARDISAKESVVNLAIPHSEETKAIIDKCMKTPYIKNILNIIRFFFTESFTYKKLLIILIRKFKN